jgi:hypothetical protein
MALGKTPVKTGSNHRHLTYMNVAAAAAGGIAAAAYLDGKYQIRRELDVIRKLKRAERQYAKRGMSSSHHRRICTKTTEQ